MKIDRIVIHCSDSPHGRGDDAETIHRWHLERGWDGIGYHYVLPEWDEIQLGRPHYWTGAHVRGFNEGSLGICLIGKHTFKEIQLENLCLLTAMLLSDYPEAQLFNHYDLDPTKTCPNFNAVRHYRLWESAQK